MKVKNRHGELEDLDPKRIKEVIEISNQGVLSDEEINHIIESVKHNIFEGMDTSQINNSVLMSIVSYIEKGPEYSQLAARFLLNDLYRSVLGVYSNHENFKEIYKQGVKDYYVAGINSQKLSVTPDWIENYIPSCVEYINPENDFKFTYIGAKTLHDRYLLRDGPTIFELPQYMWIRIALFLAAEEKDRKRWAKEFYTAMSDMKYIPSTPTLFNAGTHSPQLSSCYLNTVQDDLKDIFKAYSDNAQLSKYNGGIGTDWTNLRATNSFIKSTQVGSSGIIPFLKIADSTTAAINRSGKRRGAACAYLEVWHMDIFDFIDLRKHTGDDRRRTHDLNTAAWIPDLFMKRVEQKGKWTLFSPNEVPDLHDLWGSKFESRYEEYEQLAKEGKIQLFKEIDAGVLWKKIINSLYSYGHPWITFKDTCNSGSPQKHCGVVHGSNLCTEITLNTSKDEVAVCNLGSINLANHAIKDGYLDLSFIHKTVKTAVRMLDNVIDLNFYPIPEAKNSNIKHRPIGLGVLGFQDLLYKLNLNFDSDEAVNLSSEIMENISYGAINASMELADEKGKYASFHGSDWSKAIFPFDHRFDSTQSIPENLWWDLKEKVRRIGIRNSNIMAIAPTATISNISGVYPSIEPTYSNIYTKSNVSGEFLVINKYLIEDLKELDLWNEDILSKIKKYDGDISHIKAIPKNIKEKYRTVFQMDPIWIIKHASVRQRWIDQSQSINIFTSTSSGKALSEIYFAAWKMGLKTTYYLRTLGASSVEKSSVGEQACSLEEGCESCQ